MNFLWKQKGPFDPQGGVDPEKHREQCCPVQKSAAHLPPLVGSAVLEILWGGPTRWHSAWGGQLVPRAHRRPVCWNITKRSLGLSTSGLREDAPLRKRYWRFRWFLCVPLVHPWCPLLAVGEKGRGLCLCENYILLGQGDSLRPSTLPRKSFVMLGANR